MGVTLIEKAKSAANQLNVVDKTWYVQWRDCKALRAGPVIWEIFLTDFIGRLFSREMREAKVE